MNVSTETIREIGRIVAGGYYDHQETRISAMNRLRDIIRKRYEDIDSKTPEKKKEKKEYGKKYQDTNIGALMEKIRKDKKFTDSELEYIQHLLELLKDARKLENQYKSFMMQYVETEQIYNEFLEKIKGISGVLASNLIKNLGYCETFQHVSSVWKYCGLHVVDGHAPKLQKGQKVDFNPKMRTLMWKISDSFVKQRTPIYREIYDLEKERQHKLTENEAENAPKSKMHADLRARRKMVKVFLQHYYITGRKIKGLSVSKPYAFDKLGHKHYIEPR